MSTARCVGYRSGCDGDREDRVADSGHPSITAIVVNWNGGELLAKCLLSLSQQTVKLSSIIVVDNASTDGSNIGIEEKYKNVQLVQLDRNTGFAGGNNIGLSEAGECDWIVLVNPDAFPEPDWLERLLAAVRDYPEYAFFGSRMLSGTDRAILDGAGDIYHVSGRAWRRHHGQVADSKNLSAEEVFSPCAAAGMYSREILLEVDGFDESYFAYFEDTDLSFRLRLAGYRCLFVPDAVVHHVGSAVTGKRSEFTIYHGHRNLVWTYFKNMPTPLFWLYLPQHVALNVASLVWFALRGRAKVIFKAKWDAIVGLPRILKERRRIQRTRRVGAFELRSQMQRGWPRRR